MNRKPEPIDKSETNYININGRNIYLNEYIKRKSLKQFVEEFN